MPIPATDAISLNWRFGQKDVRRAMPRDGIVTLDNGVYKIWFARNYKAKSPNTVLLDNALAASAVVRVVRFRIAGVAR